MKMVRTVVALLVVLGTAASDSDAWVEEMSSAPDCDLKWNCAAHCENGGFGCGAKDWANGNKTAWADCDEVSDFCFDKCEPARRPVGNNFTDVCKEIGGAATPAPAPTPPTTAGPDDEPEPAPTPAPGCEPVEWLKTGLTEAKKFAEYLTNQVSDCYNLDPNDFIEGDLSQLDEFTELEQEGAPGRLLLGKKVNGTVTNSARRRRLAFLRRRTPSTEGGKGKGKGKGKPTGTDGAKPQDPECSPLTDLKAAIKEATKYAASFVNKLSDCYGLDPNDFVDEGEFKLVQAMWPGLLRA